MNIGDGTGVGSVGLDIALGLPPGTIEGLIQVGTALFDFLFGGGHAGSCGSFRDQFFQVKNTLDPAMDKVQDLYGQAAIKNNTTPTAIMSIAGPTILPAIDVADQQFDKFKGSNLLGQTMFASRIHLYLFKRWAGNQMFGNQQWCEYRLKELFTSLGNNWTNLIQHSKTLETHTLQISDLQKLTPRVKTLETAMAATKAFVDTMRITDIPGLQKSVTDINTFVNGTLSPLVTKHSADLGQLLANTIPGITKQITSLGDSITTIQNTYATKQELTDLGKQLSDCCKSAQDKIVLLQTDMTSVLKRLGVHDGRLDTLDQAVKDLKAKDLVIDGTLSGLQQQITSLQKQALTFATQKSLDDLKLRVAAIEKEQPNYARKTAITDLQTQIDKIVKDITGLTKSVDFLDLKARVAAVEQQLPTFAKTTDLKLLQDRVTTVEGKLPSFAKDVDFQALKKVVDSLVSAGIVRDQLLSQHSGQIVTLQQKDTDLQNQITAAQKRLTNLETLGLTYAKASDIPLLQKQITAVQQTMGTLASKQQITDLQKLIDAISLGDTARSADIAALKAQVTALTAAQAGLATTAQIAGLQKKIDALTLADTAQLSLISGLQSQMTAAQKRIDGLTADLQKLRSDYDIEKAFLDKALPQLQAIDQKIREDLDVITTKLQQQTWPELVRHGERIALLEKQKVETVLPAIAKIWLTIQQIDQTIQNTINNPQWFTQNTYQRIYNYFGQPDITTQQTVNNIVNMIQNTFVTNQQITNNFIQKLMVQITQQYTINQQVTNQFITNVMQQITNQFVTNQQTTLQYVSQFYQTTNNLYQTNQQVTNYVTQQVTNVLNNLYQTTEVNYTTIQKVTHNLFKSYVTNIFNDPPQDLCAAVRRCVTDQKEALCDFGRKAWGKMGECWLDANTPTLAGTPDILLAIPTLTAVAQDFLITVDHRQGGRYAAKATASAALFFTALDGIYQGRIPFLPVAENPGYIFEVTA